MASPLSLLIGLRFSRGRRRGGMVSLISVISTIGIALGVAVLIVGLSAMNGFERELNNRILAVVPHGEIEPVNQPWTNWSDALNKVEKVPGIAAAAPYINFTGLVESGVNLRAIQVKGVNPRRKRASARCRTMCRTARGPTLRPASSRSSWVKALLMP
jgi:lipoprotein-releasing system permease protein